MPEATPEAKKENPIISEIHKEMQEALKAPLTPAVCQKVTNLATLAKRAFGLLGGSTAIEAAVDMDADGEVPTLDIGRTPLVANYGNNESFGQSMIRQLVSVLSELGERRNATPAIASPWEAPSELVRAIHVARQEGLTDIADELSARLRAQTAPVNAGPATSSDHATFAFSHNQSP